ncbi:MAG: beta-galactosidase, partial [Clostridia bacterium]|nr:beta-galactosidase [Clostridia bacterium]
ECTVPGHVEMQGYGQIQYVNTQYPWDGREKLAPPQTPREYNPVSVYQRTFEMAPEEAERPARLIFDGAESCLFALLNGELLGYGEDSFTPKTFDVTGKLKVGENTLTAVTVHFCSGSWLEDQDFWRFSGLFRPVHLCLLPRRYIERLSVRAAVDETLETGSLLLCAGGLMENCQAEITLCTDAGQTVYHQTVDAQELQDLTIPVDRPVLWSAEIPRLYTLSIALLYEGKAIRAAQTRVGFRRFELKKGVMTLNGKRLVFCGVNRHEFHCDRGRALTEQDIRDDLLLLKKYGFNAVRTSHYPNQSCFYALCDELGLYVVDEANIESHGSWMVLGKRVPGSGNVPGDHAQWLAASLRRVENMFERDQNHPAILLWSLGNESCGGSVLRDCANWLRRRDDTRLIHYEGIFWDRRYPETSDVESRMYAKPDEIIAYLESKPNKPLILCEYAHAMGNSCGDLRLYMELQDRYEQYQGGFLWDFKDQAIRQN